MDQINENINELDGRTREIITKIHLKREIENNANELRDELNEVIQEQLDKTDDEIAKQYDEIKEEVNEIKEKALQFNQSKFETMINDLEEIKTWKEQKECQESSITNPTQVFVKEEKDEEEYEIEDLEIEEIETEEEIEESRILQ